MSGTIKLAEYIFTRLGQLGVKTIHGVPGDYNLELLDYVEPSGLHWTGSCNELNGGYAADGYARINGIGALITTFGVGELSAINAIAGAYAELAPVVHIVGTPTRQQHESRSLIHHTLNDGEYGHFAAMYKHVTVAQADLSDPRTAVSLFDAALAQCLLHHRPVYIQIPVDMVAMKVSSVALSTPVEVPLAIFSGNEHPALDLIQDRMKQAKKPVILVDGESLAYGILEELHQLIESTGWPTWTSNFGKGCVDETLPNTRGVWKGNWSTKEDQDYVRSADLILCFGPHFSGTNSYFYTGIPPHKTTIYFKSSAINIEDQVFRDLPVKQFLAMLLKEVDLSALQTQAADIPYRIEEPATPRDARSKLDQHNLYAELQKFLRTGDIIMGETGTAGYGVREFKLPKYARLFKPSTWLSIGYMLPAAQGAALAQREMDQDGKWHRHKGKVPRTMLLIGDGSFQMTVQELSTIIREKLNVTIILLNNDGYTIERCIHGKDQGYNDVARWRYLSAPAFFGVAREESSVKGEYLAHTSVARTVKDLQEALERADERAIPALDMIEVILDREDAMSPLSDLLAKQN
ncbi:Putative thiamine pyrophosphate enzyme TPP-binding, thiamine pyrophosphate enzyme, central [Septoria linicola]|uniref:Pyruvate decarboxylase n=1 Tax=Septoria linicola TaxID=215465 RepID=A0A9Q9B7A4_9PEZI|nr:putative thiamine pyrophosphate enzyme TPP-binding, thiamine pyrophosphate enzyme, central [Septoria linicola]USW58632.1 Putative thiamine pyrophosphate enzyme TPP-binding, thiamine pyrophosphate enzyme, central [Septoria linicola]